MIDSNSKWSPVITEESLTRASIKNFSVANRQPPLNWERFLQRVTILEAAKRDDIPETTIRAWYQIFIEQNWSEEVLSQKFNSIMKAKSYGKETVRIDDFFEDEPLYTYAEMIKHANLKVERLIKTGENILKFNYPTKSIQHFFWEFYRIKAVEIKAAVVNRLLKVFSADRMDFIDEIINKIIKEIKNG